MNRPNRMVSTRDLLICLLVFFAVILLPFTLLFGAIIAVMLYFLLQYRNRLKRLEKQLEQEGTSAKGGQPSSEP